MPKCTWLITGSSRGIGLETAKQLLASPANVVLATCRNPSQATALVELTESAPGRLHVIELDVTDDASVRRSVERALSIVGEGGIDYLINNAALMEGMWTVPSTMDLDALTREFQLNVLGPARMYQAYLPLVAKSQKKTVVNVSSRLGSIGSNCGIVATTYSITKSALNMLTYKEHIERPDLMIISMDPGHLKTAMGGPTAILEVSEGVQGVLDVVGKLKEGDSGKFFNFRGELRPW
ncbi:NAD-P-binding protein [Cubamyces sp. BRFM 1775]|nr:NAD-P-binding protein [Cubamyces sp. BRFM 1775]